MRKVFLLSLLLVSVVIFIGTSLLPGDVTEAVLGNQTSHHKMADYFFTDDRVKIQLVKLLGELDLRAACASLRMPALILHGHADAVIPPAAAERLARDIPGARARRHSTAGHDLPLREPAWVGREILSFLDVSP